MTDYEKWLETALLYCKRIKVLGSPWPPIDYFQQRAESSLGSGKFLRKVIHIRAEDDPNIRYGYRA